MQSTQFDAPKLRELLEKLPPVELEPCGLKCKECKCDGYIYLKNNEIAPLCDVCADPIDVCL